MPTIPIRDLPGEPEPTRRYDDDEMAAQMDAIHRRGATAGRSVGDVFRALPKSETPSQAADKQIDELMRLRELRDDLRETVAREIVRLHTECQTLADLMGIPWGSNLNTEGPHR